ncbi:MAG TPA: type III-B CRISPR module-associated Cmr3 family protein [Gemmataceae bacterium]|nr:type III-B CRISPR module-associated Cmr3 family protein [Gemmataceae bacterium]
MSVVTLQITARDPIVARDGRPFGAGQGNRMRGLGWPLPSVVAGSFRTVLVKANPSLDFADKMPQRLMRIEVAGVFPTFKNELYLPSPSDAVAEPSEDGKAIKLVHRVTPQPNVGGCDFPDDLPLQPVVISEDQAKRDFKPRPVPAWWPVGKLTEWLLRKPVTFDATFLNAAIQETRDHVCLDADTGTAAEGELFTTAGLNVTHLPRYGVEESKPVQERFAEVSLTGRVTITEHDFDHLNALSTWHPLGGERRLVHWKAGDPVNGWTCPDAVKSELASATRIRMVLATPAIFEHGWRPGWLDASTLTGEPFGDGPTLKLVGVSNSRWKAVSGWSLAKINSRGELDPNGKPGPKAIRRMVPAGGVYFFEVTRGEAAALADHWLKSVSDGDQERRDGFGLAVWGTW